jgi:hypothetical protein
VCACCKLDSGEKSRTLSSVFLEPENSEARITDPTGEQPCRIPASIVDHNEFYFAGIKRVQYFTNRLCNRPLLIKRTHEDRYFDWCWPGGRIEGNGFFCETIQRGGIGKDYRPSRGVVVVSLVRLCRGPLTRFTPRASTAWRQGIWPPSFGSLPDGPQLADASTR